MGEPGTASGDRIDHGSDKKRTVIYAPLSKAIATHLSWNTSRDPG